MQATHVLDLFGPAIAASAAISAPGNLQHRPKALTVSMQPPPDGQLGILCQVGCRIIAARTPNFYAPRFERFQNMVGNRDVLGGAQQKGIPHGPPARNLPCRAPPSVHSTTSTTMTSALAWTISGPRVCRPH